MMKRKDTWPERAGKQKRRDGQKKSKNPKKEEDSSSEDEQEEFSLTNNRKTPKMANTKKMLYVVLEEARVESAKIGSDFKILNGEEHKGFIRSKERDPADYRPDITHQCLLNLLDSPINRAGNLRIFIHTCRNVLIRVNPQCRIPRTYPRFAGLMVQLLQKMKIKAANSDVLLLEIIANPVEDYLPVDCRKITFTKNCPLPAWPNAIPIDDNPVVVVIGAMASGSIEPDYCNEKLSISKYPLSAALTCAKICSGFEQFWGIH